MYTTEERVEAYLDRSLTDNELIIIDDTISYISDLINTITNRNWLPVSDDDSSEDTVEATARLFDGNGTPVLTVDDFSNPTMVRILDLLGQEVLRFTTPDTDWLTTPANDDIKQTIKLRNYTFPVGLSNIEITAEWGSGMVPDGVINIATALVGKYLQEQGANTGKFKSESIEGYSYTLLTGADIDSDKQKLIDGLQIYKKYTL